MDDYDKSKQQLIKELSELRLENYSLKLKIGEAGNSVAEKGYESREVIKASANSFHELMDQTRDVIYLLSTEGIILSLNQAFEHITGWKVSEWVGKPFMSLLHPGDVELAVSRLIEVQKGSISQELELRIHKKSGEYIYCEILSSLQMKDGIITGVLGIGRDITDRKRNEEALASERNLLLTLVDLLPAYIYIKDRESRFQIVNAACADFMGALSPKEMVGRTDEDYYQQEIAAGFRADELQVLEGIPIINKEQITVSSHGTERILLTTKVPLRDNDKNIIGLVGTSVDITETKRAENALRESEENFRVLFDENPLPTIMSELPSGAISFANKRMAALMGLDTKDIYGKTANDLGMLNNPDDQERLTKLITDQGFVNNVEIDKVLPDGGKGTDLVFMRLVNILGKHYCLTVIQDITDRKHAEEAIIKAREKAEESDRLKSAFLANMGHEIRTPMNGILGFSELLKNPSLTGEEQMAYVNIIEKSGARMLNIINDLIDISKIESGQMNIQLSGCNINEQTEYILAFFKPEIESKGLIFSLKNGLSAKEAILKTDKEKVNAVLINLIKNAIKFTDKGSIEFGYTKKTGYLEFYVRDSGVGISPEHKEIIFERFRQGSESLNRRYEGAGLGLSISKSFVEMLEGNIWVESKPGEGSVFYFTIPWNSELNENDNKKKQPLNEVRYRNKNLKILITEDDTFSLILISNIIKDFSSNVLKANSGNQAVDLCKNNPDLDLILMDIKIPGMDGFEATRQIRHFNKNVIIIAQTAYAQTGDRHKAEEAGCNDYIAKPILKTELISLIKKYFPD
jgi:PAS domain S-box-containing protein